MEIEIDNNLSIRELPIDKKTQQSEAHMYKLQQRGRNNVYMPKYQWNTQLLPGRTKTRPYSVDIQVNIGMASSGYLTHRQMPNNLLTL